MGQGRRPGDLCTKPALLRAGCGHGQTVSGVSRRGCWGHRTEMQRGISPPLTPLWSCSSAKIPPPAALNGRDEQGPALGGYTDPQGILSAFLPSHTGSLPARRLHCTHPTAVGLPADSPSSPRGGFFSCCLTPRGEENPMDVASRLQPASKAACLGAGGFLCMHNGVGRKKTQGVSAQPDPQVTSPGCCANTGSHWCPGFPSARR